MKLTITLAILIVSAAAGVSAQKAKPRPRPAAEAPIVFAVLQDGKRIEPVVQVEKGRLVAPVDGGQESSLITAFANQYYKAGRKYPVVFGGANVGTATVVSNNAKAECARNTADVTSKVTGATLKGFVMALATSIPVSDTTSSRRKPTTEERAEIETLVRGEYTKQKINGTLRSHNLTALDVDNDGTAELVGSYWIANAPKQRAVLFFIANKTDSGKYAFGFSEYRLIKEEEVMSNDITALDGGIYHEMLLDTLDTDGDGTGEIFTHVQSFEGAGFLIYKRSGAKWNKVFEGSNYHCAY
jgi:hypothetical protein